MTNYVEEELRTVIRNLKAENAQLRERCKPRRGLTKCEHCHIKTQNSRMTEVTGQNVCVFCAKLMGVPYNEYYRAHKRTPTRLIQD